jgi:hypothetical protein
MRSCRHQQYEISAQLLVVPERQGTQHQQNDGAKIAVKHSSPSNQPPGAILIVAPRNE